MKIQLFSLESSTICVDLGLWLEGNYLNAQTYKLDFHLLSPTYNTMNKMSIIFSQILANIASTAL